MGKMVNILLGRSFKGSKLKALVNLAISRLSVLKNQRQARYSAAISDVIHVLRESERDRALIRVEQVIREQNVLDALAIIQGFCILLSEKIELIDQEKNCPEDLKEAISSLIFAASRFASGNVPELQQMRSIFATCYGKEFVLRAVELRNNCGVNPLLIQKLSTRQPSLEGRIKVLKEIADKNGISLQLEEATSISTKENHPIKGEDVSILLEPNFTEKLKEIPKKIEKIESVSISLNKEKQYRDAIEAAQEAFLSAAYAATAARAAVELSRSSRGSSDDLNRQNYDQKTENINNSSKVKFRREMNEKNYSRANESYDFSSNDEKEISRIDEKMRIEQIDSRINSSSMSLGISRENEEKRKFDESDGGGNYVTDKQDWGEKSVNISGYEGNSGKDDEEQMSPKLGVKNSEA